MTKTIHRKQRDIIMPARRIVYFANPVTYLVESQEPDGTWAHVDTGKLLSLEQARQLADRRSRELLKPHRVVEVSRSEGDDA